MNHYMLSKFLKSVKENLNCSIPYSWASKHWKSVDGFILEDALVGISKSGDCSLRHCLYLAYYLFEERNFKIEDFHLIRGSESNLEALSKGLYSLYYQGQFSKRDLLNMGILS